MEKMLWINKERMTMEKWEELEKIFIEHNLKDVVANIQ